MENLFIENASTKALDNQKKNALISKIISNIQNAYTNASLEEPRYWEGGSTFQIGAKDIISRHTFTVSKRFEGIKFESHALPISKEKQEELKKKYPESYYDNSIIYGFKIIIENINDENINDVIGDIVLSMESGGLTLRY